MQENVGFGLQRSSKDSNVKTTNGISREPSPNTESLPLPASRPPSPQQWAAKYSSNGPWESLEDNSGPFLNGMILHEKH